MKLQIGTKSILIGAHNFIIHPYLVYRAWCMLFGFTLSPYRLVQFLVHDWGYAGCADIDGDEGKLHPYLGARIVSFLFDWGVNRNRYTIGKEGFRLGPKGIETLFHSRFMTRRHCDLWGNRKYERYGASCIRGVTSLCVADKLAFCLERESSYIFRIKLSGEIVEYCARYDNMKECYDAFWNHNMDTALEYFESFPKSEWRDDATGKLYDLIIYRVSEC